MATAWTHMTTNDMPVKVAYPGIALIDTTEYYFGGSSLNLGVLNNVQINAGGVNPWTQGAPMPYFAYRSLCFFYGTKIYVIGGFTGDYAISGGERNTVQIYDTVANSWSQGAQSPYGMNNIEAVGVIVGNEIWIKRAYANSTAQRLDWMIYNISGNYWTGLNDTLKLPIRYFDMVAINKHLYILGAWDYNAGYLKNVISYDTELDKWETHAPTLYNSPFVAEYGGEIYAAEHNKPTCRYSPANDTFETIAPPIAESNIAVSHANHTSVVLGGQWRLVYMRGEFGVVNRGFLDISVATVSNPSPSAGFVNEQNANTFSWSFASNSGAAQFSAIFQWRVYGSPTVNTINIAGAVQSVTIPANTLPNGAFEWRVRATGSNLVQSEWTDWLYLTTIDMVHTAPTNLLPAGGKVNTTTGTQLSWVTHSPLSTPQKAFEIQIRYTGQNWQNFSGVVQNSLNYFAAAPNAFVPAEDSIVNWRVRTYNSDNVAGVWSTEASFLALTAPQAPRWISVEQSKSRPLCRWTATGQIGWHLQVTLGNGFIFDSGERFGTERESRVMEYIPNGQFVFRLRIVNELGIWSSWSDFPVRIDAPKRINVTLEGGTIDYGAELTFEIEMR